MVIYFLIYIILLIFSVRTQQPVAQVDNLDGGFYESDTAWFTALFDLKASGFGDALPGLFAPLAFLWLDVMLIQSNQLCSQQLELHAQRSEMKAQHHKMELQRKKMDEAHILTEKQIAAAEAQTKAAKNSFEAITKQVRLLDEQVKVGKNSNRIINK